MPEVIDKTYLPFTVDQLLRHFTGDDEEGKRKQVEYYVKSAERYHQFMSPRASMKGVSVTESKLPRQIEKDERFWTVTALKTVYEDKHRTALLENLLSQTYGKVPPLIGISTWKECLTGNLKLYFEACLPSPRLYVNWLASNLKERQMIPYVQDAADSHSPRRLEGPTHVDALLVNLQNGFAWLIEAKVLSDVSPAISFDNFRNQIARNIDVMLEKTLGVEEGLEKRDPEKTLFGLLTPKLFKDYRTSRLYGWLMGEYQKYPEALARDLCHRNLRTAQWAAISRRLGWVTFEDFNRVRPGACPWLKPSLRS